MSRHPNSPPSRAILLSHRSAALGVEGPAVALDRTFSAAKSSVPRPFAPFANGRETSTPQSGNVILSQRSESKDLRLLFGFVAQSEVLEVQP